MGIPQIAKGQALLLVSTDISIHPLSDPEQLHLFALLPGR